MAEMAEMVEMTERAEGEKMESMTTIPKLFLSAHTADDYVLLVEGSELHVSKGALAAQSPVLDTMVFNNGFRNAREGMVDLEGKTLSEFIPLLCWVYKEPDPASKYKVYGSFGRGSRIADDDLFALITLADEYEMKRFLMDLREVYKEFIAKGSVSKDDALHALELLEKLGMTEEEVNKISMDFITAGVTIHDIDAVISVEPIRTILIKTAIFRGRALEVRAEAVKALGMLESLELTKVEVGEISKLVESIAAINIGDIDTVISTEPLRSVLLKAALFKGRYESKATALTALNMLEFDMGIASYGLIQAGLGIDDITAGIASRPIRAILLRTAITDGRFESKAAALKALGVMESLNLVKREMGYVSYDLIRAGLSIEDIRAGIATEPLRTIMLKTALTHGHFESKAAALQANITKNLIRAGITVDDLDKSHPLRIVLLKRSITEGRFKSKASALKALASLGELGMTEKALIKAVVPNRFIHAGIDIQDIKAAGVADPVRKLLLYVIISNRFESKDSALQVLSVLESLKYDGNQLNNLVHRLVNAGVTIHDIHIIVDKPLRVLFLNKLVRKGIKDKSGALKALTMLDGLGMERIHQDKFLDNIRDIVTVKDIAGLAVTDSFRDMLLRASMAGRMVMTESAVITVMAKKTETLVMTEKTETTMMTEKTWSAEMIPKVFLSAHSDDDYVLLVEDIELHVSKKALAAESPVLETLLFDTAFRNAREGRVNLEGKKLREFIPLLCWVYKELDPAVYKVYGRFGRGSGNADDDLFPLITLAWRMRLVHKANVRQAAAALEMLGMTVDAASGIPYRLASAGLTIDDVESVISSEPLRTILFKAAVTGLFEDKAAALKALGMVESLQARGLLGYWEVDQISKRFATTTDISMEDIDAVISDQPLRTALLKAAISKGWFENKAEAVSALGRLESLHLTKGEMGSTFEGLIKGLVKAGLSLPDIQAGIPSDPLRDILLRTAIWRFESKGAALKALEVMEGLDQTKAEMRYASCGLIEAGVGIEDLQSGVSSEPLRTLLLKALSRGPFESKASALRALSSIDELAMSEKKLTKEDIPKRLIKAGICVEDIKSTGVRNPFRSLLLRRIISKGRKCQHWMRQALLALEILDCCYGKKTSQLIDDLISAGATIHDIHILDKPFRQRFLVELVKKRKGLENKSTALKALAMLDGLGMDRDQRDQILEILWDYVSLEEFGALTVTNAFRQFMFKHWKIRHPFWKQSAASRDQKNYVS